MQSRAKPTHFNSELKSEHQSELKVLGQKLRQAGVQPTLQRTRIYEFVTTKAQHPTADQVFEWAQQELGGVSLATVYNTLNTFVKAGLLKEVQLPMLDKAIYDCNLEHHFHFFDESTGQIFDLSPEEIQFSFRLPNGVIAHRVELFISGQGSKFALKTRADQRGLRQNRDEEGKPRAEGGRIHRGKKTGASHPRASNLSVKTNNNNNNKSQK